jgi:hypothetical protein
MYRSPQLYARLRADMDADNATDAVSGSYCSSANQCVGLEIMFMTEVFGRFG